MIENGQAAAGELADRLDLLQLVNRYAVHADLKEIAAWAGLFETDGVLDETALGFGLHAGHDALLAYGRSLFADNIHAVHFMTNHVLGPVEGDRATGTAFGLVEAITHSSGRGRYYVMYRDDYRRSGGLWRFARRVVSPLFPPMPLPPV